ncbi:MAG: DUF1573 domain-containing protein [Bacteroidales bacterium]
MEQNILKIRLIPVVLVIMAMITTSFTTSNRQPNDGIVKWHKTTHDFGTILQNKPVNAEFRFTNVSTHPIVITRVVASCGCTVPKYDELPILPGKEGIIRTSFDAESRGVFHKKITVLMDVGNYEIFVKGLVVDKL